ncbi:4-hydroxy-2-oxoglutarate aldolase, mitochondrial-like [Portunus trituberculatus]|uniref:4-hydroxy-2-oxoglutarate aldolase, mitochondrial-like n=1 Tax=Portunus trituberculatus TaxID=210409 RepID=UPI001E1CC150|nr:4-hydroxy-2-oxoglutarate aldolase, mitochondrial-like [Portunus trituberculatus]
MLWKSLLTSIRSTVLRVPGRSVCVSVAGRAAAASKAAPTQQLDLGGVYPPMPTPFLKDEAIAYDQLASNVGVWSTMPFRGLVVEGSNGEYVYLTPEERVELVSRVREFLPQDSNKLVLAGSGCESTRDTIAMSQKMAVAGADAVMVVTPSYYKGGMKDAALHAHFTAVADNCPVPVILYSVPAFTVIDLSLDVIADLAHHPNIIGIKESGGDIAKIGSIVQKTQNVDFQVIAGSASFLLATLQIGGVGGVCALANVLGQSVCELQRLVMENDMSTAIELQKKLIAPNAAVTKTFGIPGLKQVMDWMGMYGGPLRSPLQPLTQQETEKLRQVFVNAGYL